MTKDGVLAILIRERGYVSGETMSKYMGVSRAAINMAVKALRSDGYIISSSTNKGYFLEKIPDKLTAGALLAQIGCQRMGNVLCLDTVDSTNKVLRDMAFEGAKAGQIVIADEQTSGKGRVGRTFESPKNKGIYLSMLFRPDCMPADTVNITAWTAVAVSKAIENVCGVKPGIKWVNDLVMNGKKICGILTELSIETESMRVQHIIIGVGVNVCETAEDFSPEIREKASSIQLETGKSVSRAVLAAEMIKELDIMCSKWPESKDEYLQEYRDRCITTGGSVCVMLGDTKRTGKALEINDDFSVKIQYDDGEIENLASGEVSVRGLHGYI